MNKLGLWKYYSNVQHKQKHLKKLLSFPLKLSSASAMLIKDQNAKVKWNMYVCMNMGYLARLAQFSSKLQ